MRCSGQHLPFSESRRSKLGKSSSEQFIPTRLYSRFCFFLFQLVHRMNPKQQNRHKPTRSAYHGREHRHVVQTTRFSGRDVMQKSLQTVERHLLYHRLGPGTATVQSGLCLQSALYARSGYLTCQRLLAGLPHTTLAIHLVAAIICTRTH